MQNSIKVDNIINIVVFIIGVALIIFSISGARRRNNQEETMIQQKAPFEVLCISENGDTVARYKTLKSPKMWSCEGISCSRLEDIRTGKEIKIMTRGTIICQ